LYGRSGDDELYGGEGTENNDSCYDEPGTFILGCEQFNGEYIPPAPVPKTGQTQSYAPGDDGDLQTGVPWPDPRFTDNGNGTVTDNLTGLIWLKNANCFEWRLDWSGAVTASNDLADGDCGLSDTSSPGDWRLPNVLELQSLVHYAKWSPSLPSGHSFIGDVAGCIYWTSTSYAPDPSHAWRMGMRYANWDTTQKGEGKCVWPVRGGND
jgi:hypothetical protein